MDEKPDQIIGHIEAQRSQLGRNLNELENKVRKTTDWRTYYDRNPVLILGAALGGGVLLGATLGGSDKDSKSSYRTNYPRSASGSAIPGSSYSGGYAGNTSHIGGTYNPSRHDTAEAGSSGVGSSGSASPSSAASAGESYYGSPKTTSAGVEGAQTLMASMAQSPHIKQISETLEQVKGALIAFGIAKAKEFLAQAVPGLEQHLGDFGGRSDSDSSQSARNPTSQSNTAGQPTGRDSASGTGTGGSDYRAGSQGAGTPNREQNEFAGAGSGRNSTVTS